MIFARGVILLVIFRFSLATLSITSYINAQFNPVNISSKLMDLFPVNSQTDCVCRCFVNSKCVTVTYFGINQICSLFSAKLNEGSLEVVATIKDGYVLTFSNKIISGQ